MDSEKKAKNRKSKSALLNMIWVKFNHMEAAVNSRCWQKVRGYDRYLQNLIQLAKQDEWWQNNPEEKEKIRQRYAQLIEKIELIQEANQADMKVLPHILPVEPTKNSIMPTSGEDASTVAEFSLSDGQILLSQHPKEQSAYYEAVDETSLGESSEAVDEGIGDFLTGELAADDEHDAMLAETNIVSQQNKLASFFDEMTTKDELSLSLTSLLGSTSAENGTPQLAQMQNDALPMVSLEGITHHGNTTDSPEIVSTIGTTPIMFETATAATAGESKSAAMPAVERLMRVSPESLF